jgi:hypothetical protein
LRESVNATTVLDVMAEAACKRERERDTGHLTLSVVVLLQLCFARLEDGGRVKKGSRFEKGKRRKIKGREHK